MKTLIGKIGEKKKAMYDNEVHNFFNRLHYDSMDNDYNALCTRFIKEIDTWIHAHKLIQFTGLDKFPDRQICLGVTQQLDELHLLNKHCITIFEDEYPYHLRLDANVKVIANAYELKQGDVLIISLPFVSKGADIHPQMTELLDICYKLNVPVHIDAAWFGACRDIKFNLDHEQIKTVSFSLSKAYGMGVHRIGLRYAREEINGPINIMNKFNYVNISDVWLGLKVIKEFGPDFWWTKYEKTYYDIIKKCDLNPAKAIHVALTKDGLNGVGMRKALRFATTGQKNG